MSRFRISLAFLLPIAGMTSLWRHRKSSFQVTFLRLAWCSMYSSTKSATVKAFRWAAFLSCLTSPGSVPSDKSFLAFACFSWALAKLMLGNSPSVIRLARPSKRNRYIQLFLPAGDTLRPNPLPLSSQASKRSAWGFIARMDLSVNFMISLPGGTQALWVAYG